MSEQHTPGPWNWVIHDHSMASLGRGDDPGLGDPLVMSVGPCAACTRRANPEEWKWGRCHTPSEANANLICAAPEMLAALKNVRHFVEAQTHDELMSYTLGVIDDAVAKAVPSKAEQKR